MMPVKIPFNDLDGKHLGLDRISESNIHCGRTISLQQFMEPVYIVDPVSICMDKLREEGQGRLTGLEQVLAFSQVSPSTFSRDSCKTSGTMFRKR